MIKFFLFIFLLFFPTLTISNELNYEEEMIFDLVDLNNDGFISYEEIEQLLNPIFDIIDQSGDNKISKNELDGLTGMLVPGLSFYTDMNMQMNMEE